MDIPTELVTEQNPTPVEIPEEAPPPPPPPPPPIDAVVHVVVAARGLQAYINMEPPQNGGADITLEGLQEAIAAQGVIFNVDLEKLADIAKNLPYNRNIVVAAGVAPVDGVDGTVAFLIKTEKGPKIKENADGTVDFHDLDMVENVTQGQVLCTVTLPTEGTPGTTVEGNAILQRKGRPVPEYAGRNTELVEVEGGAQILSKINGQVEFDGHKIHVGETFYVRENVDNSTGDVKVASNLVVRGMVLPGFKIEAGGNIDVSGTVDNANVRAEGNIKLQSGITGSELYCGGDLKCRFIENCTVFVKGDILAEYVINSNIKCGKNIKIVGHMAKIIGGSYMAGQNIEASTIGSIANVRTRLELGTDHTVIERQQELMLKVSTLEKQAGNLKPLLSLLRQLEANNRLTPEKRQVYENVSYSYETDMQQIEEAKKELAEIAESIKIKGFGRVICPGTVYPGTKVVIGNASFTVTDPLNNSSLYYNTAEDVISIGLAR